MSRPRIVAALMAIALLLGTSARAAADNELASAASTFYIIATGSDSSVGPLVHTLTDSFQALFDRVAGPGAVWVIPRISWGPNELQSQCENDPGKADPNGPKVLGGVILEGTNTYNSIDPYVLWSHGWAKVSTNAQLVSCAPVGFVKPTITWVANDLHGYGSRNGFPFETVASGALAATITNTETKTILLGTAIGGISGASTIPPVNQALTARDAALRLSDDLIHKLNTACASTNPNIRPMCARLGLPTANLTLPPSE